MVVLFVLCLCDLFFLADVALCMFSYFNEWPPIGKIAAHSACNTFSWCKYLIQFVCFFLPRFLEWESFSDCVSS